MNRTYKFDNPGDMIILAKEVQVKVYWGNSFIVNEDTEDEETVGYCDFWDYADTALSDGAKSVTIEDEKYVTFNK